MSIANISEKKFPSEKSFEQNNFETRKKEILDILKDIIVVLENDIFSFSGKNILEILRYDLPKEFQMRCINQIDRLAYGLELNDEDEKKISRAISDYIKSEIDAFIKKYTYNGNEILILSTDEYKNIFSQRREMSPEKRVENIIENMGARLHSNLIQYKKYSPSQARNESSTLEGKLQKLQRINPNTIGYIIIKALKKDIETSDERSFDIFSGLLQNNYMFEGTGFGERFQDFFSQNILSLSKNAQYKILETPEGQKFLKQFLAYHGGDLVHKLSLLIFVLGYHKGKFQNLSNEIYKECIKLIHQKTGVHGFLDQEEGIPLERLIEIYGYYRSNKDGFELNFDVQKAFEDYADIYDYRDFEMYNLNHFCVSPRMLPSIYVQMSLRSYISRITGNILLERKTSEENEMKLRGLKRKGWLKKRKNKSLKNDIPLQSLNSINFSDISMNFFNGDLPDGFRYRNDDFGINCVNIVDKEDYNRYSKLRDKKPAKESLDAQKIREIRRNMKVANDPIIIRQRLYSMIVSELLYPKYSPQTWPSIGEQIRKSQTKKKRGLDIQKENELLKTLSHGEKEGKLGKQNEDALCQGGIQIPKNDDFDDIPF